MLLATGLTALIGISAVVHMAVSLGLVPTTGLPLPLLSYGRTNLIVSMVAVGVLVSVGRGRGRVGARGSGLGVRE
jgi:cell division protein FtsW